AKPLRIFAGIALRSGVLAVVGDAGPDGIDHRFPDDGLAVGFTHVLDGAAHHFGFFRMTRLPLATGNQRSALKFLHRSLPSLARSVDANEINIERLRSN